MKTLKSSNRGQVLVLFVLAIFGLFAMSMLVLDGGQAYMNRRSAQAAADAGALAGARELCFGSGAGSAKTVAENYATVQNGANTALASVGTDTVHVDVGITQKSFIAQIFGRPQVDVQASAEATCIHPSGGKGPILPVAWSCRAPIGGSISTDCDMQALDWTTQLNPLITGTPNPVDVNGVTVNTPFNFKKFYLDEIYVVMDSINTQMDMCGIGGIVCDIDGDGHNDLIGGGDRSWLDLNGGGGGASELSGWIKNGIATPISVHTWVPGQDGTAASIFKDTADYQLGQVALVPVINAICVGNPTNKTACKNMAHATFPLPAGHNDVVNAGGGASATYYHISGFAAFYISCVDSGSEGGEAGPKGNECPGHALAVSKGTIGKNDKTIEGYFVTGYKMDVSGTGGMDLGIEIISLTK